jgi:hypothetical protein
MGRGMGGAMGGNMPGRGAGAAAAQTGKAQNAPQTMYWLYLRPGGATLTLTLNPKGVVTAITLSGVRPYPPGLTTRRIGLGNSYLDVIHSYGYPDQATPQAAALDLTYIDHGVRFHLDGMKVTQITIGAYVMAAVVPVPAAPGPATPPAGMGVNELQGYM